MKQVVALIVLAIAFTACQQKKQQYFEAAPEIDLVKNLDKLIERIESNAWQDDHSHKDKHHVECGG